MPMKSSSKSSMKVSRKLGWFKIEGMADQTPLSPRHTSSFSSCKFCSMMMSTSLSNLCVWVCLRAHLFDAYDGEHIIIILIWLDICKLVFRKHHLCLLWCSWIKPSLCHPIFTSYSLGGQPLLIYYLRHMLEL